MLTLDLELSSMEDPRLFAVGVCALELHNSRVRVILANNQVFQLIREHEDLPVLQLKDLLGVSKILRNLVEVDHEFLLRR